MNLYKIEPDLLNKFMFKKALNDALLLLAIILVFLLILGFATEMKVTFLLLRHFGGGIFLFLLVIFFFSFSSSNIPGSTMYFIGENYFGRAIDGKGVNAFNRMTLNRLERKTGQNKSEQIYFNETKSIKITKNKIVIKGERYNFMNGNGRIVIPCEVENFAVIKEQLVDICRSNRNIERLF